MTNRHALLIGNSHYNDKQFAHLRGPAVDVTVLKWILEDQEKGSFSVQPLFDATKPAIENAIEGFYQNRKPDDLLLLYISGHGTRDDHGQLYFVIKETRGNRLRSSAIDSDFIKKCMLDSRSRRHILILDCCYSGSFTMPNAKGDALDLNQTFDLGRGYGVLTASSSTEQSFERDFKFQNKPEKMSRFTSYLADGLETGDADENCDGIITLNEIYQYVRTRMADTKPHQSPRLSVFDQDGELVIAKTKKMMAAARHVENHLPSGPKREFYPLAATHTSGGLLGSVRDALNGLSSGLISQVSIHPRREVYAPGDDIHIHIILHAEKTLAVNYADVELSLFEKQQRRIINKSTVSNYEYVDDEESGERKQVYTGEKEVEKVEFVWTEKTNFSQKGDLIKDRVVLQQNSRLEFCFDWKIPSDAVATFDGDVYKSGAVIRLAVHTPGLWIGNEYSDHPICIGTGGDPEVHTNPHSVALQTRMMESRIVLPKATYQPNEQIQGQLQISARKNLSMSNICLELLSWEKVLADDGNYDHRLEQTVQIKGAPFVKAGEMEEIPFSLTIPQDRRPSQKLDSVITGWKIKAFQRHHIFFKRPLGSIDLLVANPPQDGVPALHALKPEKLSVKKGLRRKAMIGIILSVLVLPLDPFIGIPVLPEIFIIGLGISSWLWHSSNHHMGE